LELYEKDEKNRIITVYKIKIKEKPKPKIYDYKVIV
jgi:hypothetical protein